MASNFYSASFTCYKLIVHHLATVILEQTTYLRLNDRWTAISRLYAIQSASRKMPGWDKREIRSYICTIRQKQSNKYHTVRWQYSKASIDATSDLLTTGAGFDADSFMLGFTDEQRMCFQWFFRHQLEQESQSTVQRRNSMVIIPKKMAPIFYLLWFIIILKKWSTTKGRNDQQTFKNIQGTNNTKPTIRWD